MFILTVYFCIAIIFSFLCSILEAVLLSITPAYVELASENNSPVAPTLEAFKKDIDKPLSGILTLNTFAHTIGAAGVGAQAQQVLEQSGMVDSSLTYALGAVSFFMTIAILVFSEIIPKTIGATYWERLVPFTIRSLKIIMFILAPFIWLSQLITGFFKKEEKSKSVLSRADFNALADMGTKAGIFKEGESVIIKNLIRFQEIEVRHIMTPRTVVLAAAEDQTIGEFYAKYPNLIFSRVPIYSGTMDNTNNYVLKDQILTSIIEKREDEKLSSIKRPLPSFLQRDSVPKVFNGLMKGKDHIGVLLDVNGTMTGLITIEDIVETLLGMEIVDEYDSVPDLQKFARELREKRDAEKASK